MTCNLVFMVGDWDVFNFFLQKVFLFCYMLGRKGGTAQLAWKNEHPLQNIYIQKGVFLLYFVSVKLL